MKFEETLNKILDVLNHSKSVSLEHRAMDFTITLHQQNYHIVNKDNTLIFNGNRSDCLQFISNFIEANDKPQDKFDVSESVEVNKNINLSGISTIDEHIKLPVEFKIRRWATEEAWKNGEEPYLTTRDGGPLASSVLTNVGGLIIWKAIRGDSITASVYSHANAVVVVSNTAGSPAASDTTVVNELGRKNMDTSFPMVPGETVGSLTASNRQFIVRGTFGTSDANGAWSRFWIVNSNGGGEEVLDDFSSSQGTKVSGQVWELTVTLTIT